MSGTIKARYEKLAAGSRSAFLRRARECSRLTIPPLIPPEGANDSTEYPTPYQSLGARGINNLASKYLLALYPPNTSNVKLAIDDFTLETMTQKKGMRAEVEKALGKMERALVSDMESSGVRNSLLEAFKYLLVGGNTLLHQRENGSSRLYRLDQYVCRRSPSGKVLETIAMDMLARDELDEELLALVNSSDTQTTSVEKNIPLFTRVLRQRDGTWEATQEINGVPVPNSFETYPEDSCPWLALRLVAVPGSDYSRSFVEEYRGDLWSLESVSKSLVQASAAAAKVLFLIRPGSTTKPDAITKSESGDVRAGHKDDITVLQMDKAGDFNFALQFRASLQESLSQSFLMTSGVIRDAERVTAEEIRALVQDLEQGMGGIYAVMAEELQLALIRVRMRHLQKAGRLPSLPKGVVSPQIVTGLQALGRGNDVAKLRQYAGILQETFGPEAVKSIINSDDFASRLATGMGIDNDGLVKTKEERDAEMAAAQQQALAEKATGPAVSAAGAMMKDQMAPQ